MKIDLLVAEIGSTTTVVNAFDKIKTAFPRFLGQGLAPTTVSDVTIGLNNALSDLKQVLNAEVLEANETYACSSAAGGLRMSVHGLVYNMTVRSAQEAALGAGANIVFMTAGLLTEKDLETIRQSQVKMILLSGGVDYGDTQTALINAQLIAKAKLNLPVVYAGNVVNQSQVREFFAAAGQGKYLYITENVYPKIDSLNVLPVRKIIQEVFEKHITEASGMSKIRQTVNGSIIPTPGAVLKAALLLQKTLGDLLAFDVGGATTDVFSVTEGSKELAQYQTEPVPFAKRTVEGDLGVFINKDNLIKTMGLETIQKELKLSPEKLTQLIDYYQPIPDSDQIPLVELLAKEALKKSIERHAGQLRYLYGPTGRIKVIEGKDLTMVKYVVATGGALTKLPNAQKIIQEVFAQPKRNLLLPQKDLTCLIDHDYIMASVGVISDKYPQAALKLLLNSLKVGDRDVS